MKTLDQQRVVVAAGQALLFDGAATPILYLGLAIPGSATSAAVWQIQRLDTTVGVVVTWADGNSFFDKIWDNRTTLSYA